MRQAGYTLIEILIVLFIISIVTSVALLSINRNENKQMESFANEIKQIVTLAEEQALLEPKILGLSFDEHTFRFASLQSGTKNNWLPLDDEILGKHSIPANIEVNIEVGNTNLTAKAESANKINPQIVISTNGDITPFTIYIGKKGGKPRYAVIGDANGNVTNKFLS